MILFNIKPKNEEERILSDSIKLLTTKEYGVFEMLMDGYNTREIADILNVKLSIISGHTKLIYKKLEVFSQKELIVKYSDLLKSDEESLD